jgi:hypothetical protein
LLRELWRKQGCNIRGNRAFSSVMEDPMKKLLLASSVLALSLLAVPAMAQGYYSDGYYDAPVTGAQMTDLPSMRANTTRTGSFLSTGSRYEYFDRDYYRDRDDYYRYRQYRDRDRTYDRYDDGY